MSFEQTISQIKTIPNWEGKYKFIIDLGKKMDALSEDEKSDELLIKGCQSQVWVKPSFTSNGILYFKGDSDALIVRGLVALVIQAYSGNTPDSILALQPEFIREIGLSENLSPSRTNGLISMIKQIKFYAMAFKAKSINQL